MPPTRRVHIIGCAVMQLDFAAAAAELGLTATTDYLPAGLHEDPSELRRLLQEAIDRAAGTCDLIVIGYGLCGRGLVGIHARQVPLVVPRVHDCISLFLGSNAAYREQFARCPGTYYISAGWYEQKVQPNLARNPVRCPAADPEFERLREKYGEDNAHAIVDFLNSWKRNYKRAVFIDTGAGDTAKYESYAQAMAEEFGWRYERVPGGLGLLQKALQAEAGSKELLWVPPQYVIRHDPLENTMVAAPIWQGTATTAEPPQQPPIAMPDESRRLTRLGLGIDAGGTYTDAVIYDFATRQVLGKGKALTTRWDYTIGISQAIALLDPTWLARVDLAAVSTTLATNAIVEGRGQKVGLLLMPPFGELAPDDIAHRPLEIIRGRLDIMGREHEPVDPEEVKRIGAEMRQRDEVEVFAVSGYAGTVNPEHELAVKRILQEEFGANVVCGHELSDQLNFFVRANTAVLNARIIPILRQFLGDVRAALTRVGIQAPIAIVKGDGSLMSTDLAIERPIETVLSGPAASVSGARYLTALPEATVLDIGGTTSDLARIQGGAVNIRMDGATVGGWRTHVRALEMRTTGLGGDSRITLEKQQLLIGPQRIAPVSWLGREAPAGTAAALKWLEQRLDRFAADTRPMTLVARTARPQNLPLDDEERAILAAIAEAPCSLAELTRRVNGRHWQLLRLSRLETHYLIQYCGLTPTDILHTQGKLALGDAESARRLTALYSRVADLDVESFAELVVNQMVDRLVTELYKMQLGTETNADDLDGCPVCQATLANLLAEGDADWRVEVHLQHPVVGLGAPVGYFLPAAAARLHAKAVIPEHADVANAIGAITSWVAVSKRVRVQPEETGGYRIQGLAQTPIFETLIEASDHAVAALSGEILSLARSAGTSDDQVVIAVDDRIAPAADGTQIFLERVIDARITGPPDLVGTPTR